MEEEEVKGAAAVTGALAVAVAKPVRRLAMAMCLFVRCCYEDERKEGGIEWRGKGRGEGGRRAEGGETENALATQSGQNKEGE